MKELQELINSIVELRPIFDEYDARAYSNKNKRTSVKEEHLDKLLTSVLMNWRVIANFARKHHSEEC